MESFNESQLRVSLVRNDDEFQALASEWDALAGPIPFRGWQWNHSWWRHYRDARSRPFIVVVRDATGDVIAVAPWYVTRRAAQGTVVRFLGSGEVCSDYSTVLCRPGAEDMVAERLAEWLTTDAANRWHLIDLSGIEHDDAIVTRLCARLKDRGHDTHRDDEPSCWPIHLPDSWDKYLASLPKPRRQRTRCKFRQYLDTGRAVLHSVETADDLDRAFPILLDLHQRRRHMVSQAGCFASPRFVEFHREVARHLLERGILRLAWLEIDGQPAAVRYAFGGSGELYFYQSGFDPELASMQPGWILLALTIKESIERGLRVVDMLRGDEGYKRKFGGTQRPLARFRVVSRRPAARVRYAAWRTGAGVKRWATRYWHPRAAQAASADVDEEAAATSSS